MAKQRRLYHQGQFDSLTRKLIGTVEIDLAVSRVEHEHQRYTVTISNKGTEIVPVRLIGDHGNNPLRGRIGTAIPQIVQLPPE